MFELKNYRVQTIKKGNTMLKKNSFLILASMAACVCFTFTMQVTQQPKKDFEGFSKATKPKKKTVAIS